MSALVTPTLTSKTVGEIFKVVGGGTPTTANPDFWKGPIPWVTSADLDDHLGIRPRKAVSRKAIASSATNLVPAGSVVVATRVGLGKVGIAATDLCFSQDCQGLILNPETCDSKFAAHQLKVLVQIFKHISRGTTIAGVTKKQLLELPFDLPPLNEQRRIVAEIEKQFTRLEAGVAGLRRVQANLKRYRAAVLKAACEGKLTEEWRKAHPDVEPASELLKRILAERRAKWNGKGKYREPAAPVVGTLPSTPGGWGIASLEQLSSADRVICYGILMPKKHIPDGVLYVKVRDFKGDKIDVLTLQRTSPEIANQYGRASLKAGDLLLAIRGTYGRVAEVPPELEGGNITQDTARLAVTPLVDRRYVAWFLRSEDAQNYFKRVARGVAVKGVNIGDVRPCPVLLPPLAEQERIVAEVERRLSVVEELEATVIANLQSATRLRQAVLRYAFMGHLLGPTRPKIIDTLS